MSSIKHLEMAAALSAYPHIEIKKSLFSTKAIYTPTQSQVKVYILEYSPSEGKRVERLLEMPFDQMAADIVQKGKPVAGANGNFRLAKTFFEITEPPLTTETRPITISRTVPSK